MSKKRSSDSPPECRIMPALTPLTPPPATMSTATRPHAPQPQPPVKPGNDECCHSGCTFCVLEMYQEDLAAYEDALRAWQQRQQAAATPPARKRVRTARKAP